MSGSTRCILMHPPVQKLHRLKESMHVKTKMSERLIPPSLSSPILPFTLDPASLIRATSPTNIPFDFDPTPECH